MRYLLILYIAVLCGCGGIPFAGFSIAEDTTGIDTRTFNSVGTAEVGLGWEIDNFTCEAGLRHMSSTDNGFAPDEISTNMYYIGARYWFK